MPLAIRSIALVALSELLACAPAPPVQGGLEAPSPYADLEVPGHAPAVVSLPLGATRRPVIVATHGAGDRAEYHCELWRAIVGNRGFVVCPRGRRTDNRVPHAHASYYYPDHHALGREVLAALAALRERYGEHVDTSAAVYTGFSQGAIQGAPVIVLNPDVFPRAALVEGGHGSYREWSRYSARKYRKGGGKRILFACGGPRCVTSARTSARHLERTGVATRVVHAEGAGHSYGEAMQAELERSFSWLVEDDPRWHPEP
jgi:predicted esterase